MKSSKHRKKNSQFQFLCELTHKETGKTTEKHRLTEESTRNYLEDIRGQRRKYFIPERMSGTELIFLLIVGTVLCLKFRVRVISDFIF